MRVLILCPSEICYNPRLLKAADYLYSIGAQVTVYNAVTGLADTRIYKSVKESRSWELVENDITKHRFAARIRWLYSSVINKLAEESYKRNFSIKYLFPHVLTKGYVLFPRFLKKRKFDFILIHLVDSLPYAVKLKNITGAKLIYDCQEYFKGQYETEIAFKRKWVGEAEGKFAPEANIVLATTNIMLQRLKQEFTGPISYLRVRNTPSKKIIQTHDTEEENLKIIWHGMSIVPENIRGVHLILDAVSRCKTPVELYLQGNITKSNRMKLAFMLEKLKIENKVHVIEPADPDRIVESLAGYDLGVLGELAAQDNQRLTSSNKLFEYIYAGLAVLSPDLPGLSETIMEYKVGLLYKQGDSEELAEKIDKLNNDRLSLQKFKENSWETGQTELFWENDYKRVWETMGEQIV